MLEGIVVFKLANVGSKSEGIRPFLYCGEGAFVEIWKDGDLSLDGAALREYDGKRVSLCGAYNEYEVYIIKIISEIQ